MKPIASLQFEITTSASPEQIWAALTRPDLTARYLYGLRLESEWRPGDPIAVDPVTAGTAGADDLGGEVLAVEEGRRLSYALGPAGQPATYVTWEIDGARVRLSVDEIDDDGEGKAVWRPVVAALRSLLARLLL